MKKILLCLLLAIVIGHAKSQIIITGFMSDPAGPNGNATASSPGFEYVQLMATETITFTATSQYSVVFSRNAPSSTTVSPFDGWASGSTRSYKFNLNPATPITVNKGEFFYVGGSEKRIAGYLRIGSPLVTYKSTDISETAPVLANRAKWIRAIGYFNIAGDGFGDSGVDDWLYNISGRLSGIGVFNTTTVDNTSVPIDAVFFGDAGYLTNPAYPAPRLLDVANSKGYKVPNNDLYKTVDGVTPQPYFGQGTNTAVLGLQPAAQKGYFAKLGGVYNTSANKWITARSINYMMLLDGTSTNAADASVPQLSDIQTGGVTTLDDTVLPVNLVSFTAKKQNNGVQLKWVTASEQNNRQFEILRSANGKDFNLLETKSGRGTAQGTATYFYQDTKPLSGVNYYQLRQVDFDGNTNDLGVAAVNFEWSSLNLTAAYSSESQQLNLSVYSAVATEATITITDILGRNVTKKKVSLGQGLAQIRLPVALQSGVYVATLQTAQTSVSTKFKP